MAYGKKYFVEYKSSNNLDYYCEIWVEGQTAAAIQIEIGEGGPVIEYDTDKNDRFSPIISSSCRFPFLVKNFLFAQFIDNLRILYKEKDVYLHLYRSPQSGHNLVAPLWSGFLLMDLSAGVDQSYPYEQELKFIDGLSLLKDLDFVKYPSGSPSGGGIPFEERTQGNYVRENMYYGPGTYIFWIREILQKVGSGLTINGASQNYGFTTSVNWYNQENNSLSQSSDPLHLTKCQMTLFHSKDDQGTFYPDNCYNVLKNILKHWGARITYWKGEFWIVQIPEYITNESGTLDAPVNLNSRKYSNTGAFNGSQGHLGGTYWTRYEQEISTNTISKIVGTEYNYIAPIKKVTADFLSFSSKSIYGGFPFGATAPTQEIFQGSLNGPSNADFLWLSIPLDFVWDMTTSPLSAHTGGWWLAVKFNFYASNIDNQTGVITTYYLQYTSSSNTYYWVTEANWTPLGNKSPKYVIKSKSLSETNYVGFEQQIPFNDVNGASIVMDGLWSFFLDIEDFGTSNSNPGSFYCNFSGYNNPPKMRNPQNSITLPGSISSGTVTWSNTLEDQAGVTTINIANPNPAGFNAGTSVDDYSLSTTSPFKGLLQLLSSTSSTAFGESINLTIDNSNNTEEHSFGQLVWGDTISYAQSSLESYNGTIYVPTDSNGQWGRGILTGTSTFTEMLINEFLTGQTKAVINSSFRLAVGVSNKTQTVGLVSRPRYVNPIGKLRETTAPGTDPEYFFRRGKFYTALDEWDYEGYQIIRNSFASTSNTNNIGNLGGSQLNLSTSSAPSQNPTLNALSQNSPIAYISQTVASTGANVSVNGNFNTAVGWSLGTGWSIDTTVNKAKFTATGSTSELTQSVLTQELTYQINFTVEVTAGSLLVKAGSSGTTETITSSGNYSIYLDCEGSSLIKFQASTTFTGNITHITIADQKSLSSVPIETIGTSVFKTGDTFNLINSNDSDTLNLTVTANQGSNDSTISVASTPLYEDIDTGSFLLINQDDLSEQYQNKTKGTVAGYGITATGIAKSGINITGWLNSDSMTGATVNNVPTALSVKNYVDGQVGASDTLEEVTANGNSTSYGIQFTSTNFSIGQAKIGLYSNDYLYLRGGANGLIISGANGAANFRLTDSYSMWEIGFSEKMRLTSTGLGIGTTNPGAKLSINQSSTTNPVLRLTNAGVANYDFIFPDTNTIKLETNTSSTKTFKLLNAGSGGFNLEASQATFSGQVTIPATPVATTDAASKSYVDAQVGSADTLQEVTDNGNTTTNSIKIGSSSSPNAALDVNGELFVSNGVYGVKLSYSNGNQTGIIDTFANHNLEFRINNSEKMRLTSGGNLLIGTTTDLGKVTIQNNASSQYALRIVRSTSATQGLGGFYEGSSNQGQLYLLKGDNTVNVLLNSDGNSYFNGGNLGIGTSSPAKKLHLKGTGTVGMIIESTDNGQNLDIDYYNNVGSVQGRIRYAEGTGDFDFMPNSSSVSATIKYNGNLLIGTTSDSGHKLSVAGTAKFGGQVTIPATPVATTDAASKSYVDAQVSATDSLQEVTTIGNTTTNSIMIGSSSSPTATLHVIGNAGSTTTIEGSTQSTLNLKTTSGSKNNFIVGTTAGDLSFRPNGVTSTTLKASGNLLLGTTTDNGAKLQVNGSATFASNLSVMGSSKYVEVGLVNTGTNFGFIGWNAASKYLFIGNSYNSAYNENIKIDSLGNTTLSGSLTGTTATFSGQVTIPATPVATTDAASKSYVDAQVSATDSLQEVTTVGNTTTNSIRIGSSVAPGKPLDVTGDIRTSTRYSILTSTANENMTIGFWDGNNARIESGAALPLLITSYQGNVNLGINGNTTMTVKTNSVLIGTTSDSGDKLQVNGNISLNASSGHPILKSASGKDLNIDSGSGNIYLNNNSTQHTIISGSLTGTTATFSGDLLVGSGEFISWGTAGQTAIEGSTASNKLNFLISGSSKMWLNSTGLGIGTSSPLTKLHISGTTDANIIRIENTSTSLSLGSTIGAIQFFNNDPTDDSPNVAASIYATAGASGGSGALRFKTKEPGTEGNPATDSMIITNGGRVGIGTVTPDSPLEILSTNSPQLRVTHTDNTYYMTIGHNGTFDIVDGVGSNKFDFRRDGTSKMVILTNGNVLIGTTTDSGHKLSVNGTAKFTGNVTASSYFIGSSSEISLATTGSGSVFLRPNGQSTSGQMQLASSGNATFKGNVDFPNNKGLTWAGLHSLRVESNVLKLNASGGINLQSAVTGTTGQFTGIGVATSPSAVYKLDVNGKARVQSVLELDDVLTLNAISTPADPASGKSSIYMDSADGAIKVKINVGGTVVTRTIASFE